MAIDYSKAYKKIPRSRLRSQVDSEDTIVPYKMASADARAKAGSYVPPRTSVHYKTTSGATPSVSTATAKGQRGLSKASVRAPDASLAKPGRSSAPAMTKASSTPQAYTGDKGDAKVKKGAVTSYQKDGYTYTKNSMGVFQNFGSATPSKMKKDKR